jgi:photosystem II stability/assembly factor-like uncharacterized protein
MSDLRERLERERRRFRMGEGSMEDLERRRDTRRRNRRIMSAAVAVVVAAAGATVAFVAFRDTGEAPRPAAGPPSVPTKPAPAKSLRFPPPSSTLQFLDENNGWMVFGGRVLETTDGGKNWSERLGDVGALQVQFIDRNNGWAASATKLWRTTDGGAQWQSLGDEVLTEFQFLSPELGWGVEGGHEESVGLLVKTTDGGQTWTSQDLQVNSICFGDLYARATGPSRGGISLFQAGVDGKDWGKTALPLQGAEGIPYEATVSCAGISAWILVRGDAGAGHLSYAVFRTTEGGPDVQPVLQDSFTHPLGTREHVPESTDPYPGPLAVVSDETRAVFMTWCPPCGPTASLNRTADGGETWQRFDVPQSAQGEPLGVSFIDDNRGWAAFSGTLENAQGATGASRNVFIAGTSDGGATWAELGVFRPES